MVVLTICHYAIFSCFILLLFIYLMREHLIVKVIGALVKAIDCDQKTAIDFATTVDREGRTVVTTGSFVSCEGVRKVIERQTSRQGQVPLKAVLHHTLVVAHQQFALKLLSWLHDIIGWSDGLRQLFCQIVLKVWLTVSVESLLGVGSLVVMCFDCSGLINYNCNQLVFILVITTICRSWICSLVHVKHIVKHVHAS